MAPVNVSSYDTHGTRIMVNWLPIPKYHERGIILGYMIYYQEVNETGPLWPLQVVKVKVESTSSELPEQYELRELNLTSNYSISLAGYTSIGVGVKSDVIFGMTGTFSKFRLLFIELSIFSCRDLKKNFFLPKQNNLACLLVY